MKPPLEVPMERLHFDSNGTGDTFMLLLIVVSVVIFVLIYLTPKFARMILARDTVYLHNHTSVDQESMEGVNTRGKLANEIDRLLSDRTTDGRIVPVLTATLDAMGDAYAARRQAYATEREALENLEAVEATTTWCDADAVPVRVHAALEGLTAALQEVDNAFDRVNAVFEGTNTTVITAEMKKRLFNQVGDSSKKQVSVTKRISIVVEKVRKFCVQTGAVGDKAKRLADITSLSYDEARDIVGQAKGVYMQANEVAVRSLRVGTQAYVAEDAKQAIADAKRVDADASTVCQNAKELSSKNRIINSEVEELDLEVAAIDEEVAKLVKEIEENTARAQGYAKEFVAGATSLINDMVESRGAER